MGWSLSGILGAAMVGGATAAERNFIEERRNEQALAKAKELAEFNENLRFDREQRVEEAKTKRAEIEGARQRDSEATNFELAKEYATRPKDDKDDPGAGARPGSVEYYEAQADFLNRSGRKDLAKQMLDEANRVRTDDTKDQVALARAEAARARREPGGGGGGGGGSRGKGDTSLTGFIDNIVGDFKTFGLKGDNETKDTTARFIARDAYAQAYAAAKKGGMSDDEADASARSTTQRHMGEIAAVQFGSHDALRGKSAADINANFNAVRKAAAEKAAKEEAAKNAPAPAEAPSRAKSANTGGRIKAWSLQKQIDSGVSGAREQLLGLLNNALTRPEDRLWALRKQVELGVEGAQEQYDKEAAEE